MTTLYNAASNGGDRPACLAKTKSAILSLMGAGKSPADRTTCIEDCAAGDFNGVIVSMTAI